MLQNGTLPTDYWEKGVIGAQMTPFLSSEQLAQDLLKLFIRLMRRPGEISKIGKEEYCDGLLWQSFENKP
jgi:hypothetical protein